MAMASAVEMKRERIKIARGSRREGRNAPVGGVLVGKVIRCGVPCIEI